MKIEKSPCRVPWQHFLAYVLGVHVGGPYIQILSHISEGVYLENNMKTTVFSRVFSCLACMAAAYDVLLSGFDSLEVYPTKP